MEEINKIRKEIDKIDENLRKTLKKREEKINKIAALKKAKKWKKGKVKDEKRETLIIEKAETNFQKEIFKKILSESKKIQKHILTKKT